MNCDYHPGMKNRPQSSWCKCRFGTYIPVFIYFLAAVLLTAVDGFKIAFH